MVRVARCVYLVCLGVVVVLLGLQPLLAAAEPVQIRISYTVPGLELLSMFAEKTDILKHYGTSYTVEILRFRGTSPMIRRSRPSSSIWATSPSQALPLRCSMPGSI